MKSCMLWAFAVAVLAVSVEGWCLVSIPDLCRLMRAHIFISGSCQANPESYSTSQTLLAEETVLIVRFSLSCSEQKDVS